VRLVAKNIFLTGNLQVGKTTLINKIIAALPATRISGFRTSRYYHEHKLKGFYIEDINDESKELKDKFIGRCINEDHWVSIPSTFDSYGTQVMERCLNDQSDLIVMDELGFFESDAARFQAAVFRVLDADKPVLGVLKQKETPFLRQVRHREDVTVYEINEDNRDRLFPVILCELQDELGQRKYGVKIDPEEFEKSAREVFAPVYAEIARQIKERTQITAGLCLDVGGGTGRLGIEVAKITNLSVILLDRSLKMLSFASQNVAEEGFRNRVKIILGDVHRIPLPDQSIDLVVSRGSLFFWEDQQKAFQEIYRVLVPGGIAYVGGGFGSEELKRKVDREMQERDSNWKKNLDEKIKKTNLDYCKILDSIAISNVRMIKDRANMWVVFKKEQCPPVRQGLTGIVDQPWRTGSGAKPWPLGLM
jgi:nucleoside-triphosphatase THEP1/trans-aconitate methyltransferase